MEIIYTIDINTLSEFSRVHCLAICAFLVPANLSLTLLTLFLSALRRPQVQINSAASIAFIPAIAMVLHVFSWLVVGVVMAPTYILLLLGTVCVGINFWAIAHSASIARLWSTATQAVGWEN